MPDLSTQKSKAGHFQIESLTLQDNGENRGRIEFNKPTQDRTKIMELRAICLICHE
jgi:hypothetical protein